MSKQFKTCGKTNGRENGDRCNVAQLGNCPLWAASLFPSSSLSTWPCPPLLKSNRCLCCLPWMGASPIGLPSDLFTFLLHLPLCLAQLEVLPRRGHLWAPSTHWIKGVLEGYQYHFTSMYWAMSSRYHFSEQNRQKKLLSHSWHSHGGDGL